jgi:CheY-like chemotaxis protein
MGVNIKMGVTKELLKTKNRFDFLLYYKLLTAKHPINETDIPNEDILEIKDIKKEIRVLYIDDDVEKGWDEIFCYLLYDVNKLNFEEFGSDFNDLNQTNIIENSFKKAKDFDIIILDLRLHEKDYNETNPQKLTGFRILEKIKEYNQGIQVFIFSASNKIWNLQALQEKGADGFIMKESPENSNDPNFTLNSIKNIISKFDVGVKKIFLKDLFKIINPIETNLNKIIENNKKKSMSIVNINKLIDIKEQFIFFKKALYVFPENLEWPFSILILIIERVVKDLYFFDGLDSVVSVNCINTHCNYFRGKSRYLSLTPSSSANSYYLSEFEIPKDVEMHYKGGDRDSFNFRLTCVLFYVYGQPLDDSIFKFFKLYRLRSTDVMHAGRRNSVKVDHIELALNLVSILIK